ncbi:alpha/beta hydrolase [Microbacterium sp.]|uniref:alpha/beta fold hydrolase n=1 Tax=Microbacterium sp. TaxID=51671 RepID=UPI002E373ACF|nr:alpha/beta hydrolase [Microbacterium sp.]HEX5729946.1 alpha/beta hydrolase [Microbacterium sp.]
MSEITDAGGVRLDYVVEGSGPAALVLHGAYSTRDESLPVFQPLLARRGMRGLHPDLPGMGASQQTSATSTGDVLNALDALIAAEIDAESFVVIGHSFGAHLARGVAARHPERVAGIALVSPYARDMTPAPERIVEDDGSADALDPDDRSAFLGYFQVRTAATLERYRRFVRPALDRYDGAVVESIMTDDAMDPDPDARPFEGPAAILVGRDDALVGWRAQRSLIDLHPRGTFAAVADAGHALIHERPEIVAAVLDDWLVRTGHATR